MIASIKTDFFKTLDLFLKTEIAPMSEKLDHDANLLKKTYQQLVKLGALRLLIPTQFGGMGGEREDWVTYNYTLAQYSGVLLFLQAQHQYTIVRLKQLLPSSNVEQYLKKVVKDDQGIGIGASAGNRILKPEAVDGGFRITGELGWVTGHLYFKEVFASFEYQDAMYYIKLPLQNRTENAGEIIVSDVIETEVFSSTQTVKLTINNWFISHDDILKQLPITHISNPIEHPAAYNFAGAAKALLVIAKKGKYASNPQAEKTYERLYQAWEKYYQSLENPTDAPQERRAKGRMLAENCALFARTTCGASSLLASQPINRICKEIWQYTIAGYQDVVVENYLKEINIVLD